MFAKTKSSRLSNFKNSWTLPQSFHHSEFLLIYIQEVLLSLMGFLVFLWVMFENPNLSNPHCLETLKILETPRIFLLLYIFSHLKRVIFFFEWYQGLAEGIFGFLRANFSKTFVSSSCKTRFTTIQHLKGLTPFYKWRKNQFSDTFQHFSSNFETPKHPN